MKSLGSNDLTRVTDDPLYTPGTIYTSESDHRQYKYVQWVGTTQALPNDVAYYATTGNPETGYSDNVVDSAVANQFDLGAGVLLSAPTQNQYTWIQISGFVTLKEAFQGTTPAVGDALTSRGVTTAGALIRNSGDAAASIVGYIDNVNDRTMDCDFPE